MNSGSESDIISNNDEQKSLEVESFDGNENLSDNQDEWANTTQNSKSTDR